MMKSIFSKDHKHIPMAKAKFVKIGGKWELVNVEQEMISSNQAELILGSNGLPFERSHRREKRDRFGHNHPYDTFLSISPDGSEKTVWFVDFAAGDRNYSKLVRKHFYDSMRRQKKNSEK